MEQDEALPPQLGGDAKRDRFKTIAWIIGISVLLLIAISCITIFPAHLVSRNAALQHIDRSKLENDVRTTLLQGLAGLLVVIGGIATWRQLDTNRQQLKQTFDANRSQFALTREGQITERFTHAIEQLGSDNMDLKVGGIYALERIAHDSRVDRLGIREILAAYVRGHSRWLPDKAQVVSPDRKLSDLPPLRTRTDDVQMAITVLARKSLFGPQLDHGETAGQLDPRNISGDDSMEPERIILAEVDLRGAYLRDAALGRVDFTNAHLERADLIRADLQDARLGGVHLRQAILTNANLSRAYVVGGKLQGVHLESARLNQSQLMNADLQGAHMINADLTEANLRNAALWGANMTSCNLKNCDLRGATGLEEVYGLEQGQLDTAVVERPSEE